MLNRWHVAFDPLREMVVKRHLWVILLAQPFPLWSKGLLEGIANTVGRFVALEDDFQSIFDKRMEKVMVELDISQGLPVEVEYYVMTSLSIKNWTIKMSLSGAIVAMRWGAYDSRVRGS